MPIPSQYSSRNVATSRSWGCKVGRRTTSQNRTLVSGASAWRITRLAALLLFGFVTLATASAQTFGSLSGTVTDSSNALVPGATVTVTNTATKLSRATTTSSSGYYSFPDLLAGTYSIRIEAAGFEAEKTSSVKLDAASPVSISYKLHIGNLKEVVEVEPVAPELDRTSSSIGDTFSEKQIHDLPINGRDYGRFALFTPGAVLRTANIADITFDGLPEYDSFLYLDGVDATRGDVPLIPNGYERGARLMSGSIETIAEFRVQANGYQAEYGRSPGGMLNIISKSGSSRWHGEAFDFYRNQSFDARNFFARVGSKPLFRFEDYGGNIGGPVFGKKTFIFANYEGDFQHIGVIDPATVLSSSSRAAAVAAYPALAPIVNDFPTGVDSITSPQLATTTLNSLNKVNENTASVRLDHTFSDKDSMFARYNYNQSSVLGPLYIINSGFIGLNAKDSVPTGVTNIALHEQHIFNPHFINDALVGFQRFSNALSQSEPTIPLTVIIGLSGYSGGTASTLQYDNTFQYGDSMTLTKRNHTFKWGGTFWRSQENRAVTAYSELVYLSVSSFIANSAYEVIEFGAIPGARTRGSEFGMYAQDNWQLLPNLVVNYGLRWDVASTPHDAKNTTQAYNPQTGTLFPAGHQYYPISLRGFGPRVGVAYSPTPRTVVRSGIGMFYRDYPLYYPTVDIPSNNLPGNITLLATANPGLSYPFTGYSNAAPSSAANVYGFPQYMPNTYSIQYNASVQQELTKGLAAQVAYIGLHAVGLDNQANINLYNQGTTVRPNPNFGNIYLLEDNGFESYNGLHFMLKAHLKDLTADISYAWSHAIDNVCDGAQTGFGAQNYNNIAAERGNGCQDQRHNFKYDVLYSLPMGTGYAFLGSSPSAVRALVSGWSINSLGIIHSGVPVNVTTAANTYGNGNTVNQRPNLVAGQSRYLPKAINPANGYINYFNVNAWAAPSAGTFGNSPRNPVFAIPFYQADASVVKNTSIHNDQVLEFRVEMFNIFNHPNFSPPSGGWSAGSTTFGESTSTLGSTIGFGGSRQLELALKYKF